MTVTAFILMSISLITLQLHWFLRWRRKAQPPGAPLPASPLTSAGIALLYRHLILEQVRACRHYVCTLSYIYCIYTHIVPSTKYQFSFFLTNILEYFIIHFILLSYINQWIKKKKNMLTFRGTCNIILPFFGLGHMRPPPSFFLNLHLPSLLCHCLHQLSGDKGQVAPQLFTLSSSPRQQEAGSPGRAPLPPFLLLPLLSCLFLPPVSDPHSGSCQHSDD